MTTVATGALARCRVDSIGSLLRPPALLRAFAEADAGTIDEDELRRVIDQGVREVVAEQEALGLPLITDGEFRRRWFQEGFGDVTGFAHGQLAPIVMPSFSVNAQTGQASGEFSQIATSSRLQLVFNRPLEEFVFARALTVRIVKASFMTANRIVEIFDAEGSRDVYDDVEAFRTDVVRIQRQMIDQLIRAGCEYIHIDAPGYAAYVDDPTVAAMRERGEDPDALLAKAIETDNAVIDGFDDVTFALHVCRGNFRGKWARQGGYDRVAERLYNELHHQRLLLEYDSPRAGNFDSLRFLPKGKMAVLGLISTKTHEVESADEIKRRIDEASRFIAFDQLGLSCQCGFGSTMEGNPLSVEDQWHKLELMLEVAADVWRQ